MHQKARLWRAFVCGQGFGLYGRRGLRRQAGRERAACRGSASCRFTALVPALCRHSWPHTWAARSGGVEVRLVVRRSWSVPQGGAGRCVVHAGRSTAWRSSEGHRHLARARPRGSEAQECAGSAAWPRGRFGTMPHRHGCIRRGLAALRRIEKAMKKGCRSSLWAVNPEGISAGRRQ